MGVTNSGGVVGVASPTYFFQINSLKSRVLRRERGLSVTTESFYPETDCTEAPGGHLEVSFPVVFHSLNKNLVFRCHFRFFVKVRNRTQIRPHKSAITNLAFYSRQHFQPLRHR